MAAEKTKPLLKRIAEAVIPSVKDSPQELVRKAIFAISSVIAIVCLFIIISHSFTKDNQLKTDEEMRNIREQIILTGNIPLDVETIEKVKKEEPGILDEYIPFYEQNSDIIGWIKIPGTIIDYPVMQYSDNDFYLYRSFNKEDSTHGSVFADFTVPFTADSRPDNTILHSHNMADGSYFASLTYYFPSKYGSLNYYINHPLIEFDTIYEKGVYKIFGAMFTSADVKENNGEMFRYYNKFNFDNKDVFYELLQGVMDRSVFYTDVDVEYGDEILTLSTCYFPVSSIDSRFVVYARRVRDGEDTAVDTSKAYINPSPLYFATYYRTLGTTWAGRKWDTSLLKGLDEYLEANPDKSTV